MTDVLLSPQRPQIVLAELRRRVAERIPPEAEIPQQLAAAIHALESKYAQARAQVQHRYQEDKTAAEQEYASVRRAIEAQYESQYGAAQTEYREVCAEIVGRFEAAERSQDEGLREAQLEATAVFEATDSGCALQVKEIEERLTEGWKEIESIHDTAVRVVRQRGHWQQPLEPKPPPMVPQAEVMRRFSQLLAQARSQLFALEVQSLPRLVPAVRLLAIVVLIGAAAAPMVGLWAEVAGWPWFLLGGLAAAAASLLWAIFLARAARRQSFESYLGVRQTWADAGGIRGQILQTVAAEARRQRSTLLDRLHEELRKADSKFSSVLGNLSLQMQKDLEAANAKYPALLAEITARRDRQLQEADDKYPRRLRQLEAAQRADLEWLAGDYARQKGEAEQRAREDWQNLEQRWRDGLAEFRGSLQDLRGVCDRLFPDFSAAAANCYAPPQSVPPAVRFGQYQFDLGRIEGGIPQDERLRPAETQFPIPALLPFPERSALLLDCGENGRSAAIETVQAAMLRLLTALPPGKVRFTIIDPVGLGENFAAFMYLADFDEKLVTSRIWTDPRHIEERLADLSEHMETVIQLYLRNEFQTIQQYNESAGEMAEPYRVLVVADFPANFTDAAARRLTSIICSGARCGVFTILSLDPKLRTPRDFHLKDIEPHALRLSWREGQFYGTQPEVGPLPLVCESPPPPEAFTGLVRAVGRLAKDAARVEVPFADIVPAELWTGDSREEVEVPLGRAGARKLQHLRLGRGMAQHVLISGKTGSGKSTLLHVLITNLALRYRPDQVELYLVDFKKGVEFKAYAAWQLPHAKVIAIESEREFGLSVLQRLDAELRHRGDLFRGQGVQDLKGFRAVQPGVRLPRVLLVIDEFQELFVEDDRIAQDAALLLDRLVRQGRAFGIHVLLGSQTLAGAYSLPRSTIGQMAVRIALQCNEADAHLILSEDNTAARLLSRPGEAIYNDANGLFESNRPFQVLWLPDSQRDEQLRKIHRFAEQQRLSSAAIVFEGNAAADPGKNEPLHELLAAADWPDAVRTPKAWLGSPVAIKEPTAVPLPRQSGSNLLIVGHREETALGMLATAVIGLAAQVRPCKDANGPATAAPTSNSVGEGAAVVAARATFWVLDGTPPDAPQSGSWSRLAEAIPHGLCVAAFRDTPGVVAQLAAEVARRLQANDDQAPPIFLLVYNLGRFRELRKSEDDFGYARLDEGKPPSPSKQFGEILREGPPVGVHTLVWADTLSTVQRFLDRRALGDFELRVAMHMNAADSSTLVDSPAASQLGMHRAVVYHAAEAWQEKFCPYGPPPEDWLAWVKEQFRRRQ
jgi:ABC-type multidrug transport system fused ATPase/permease subunit